MGTVLCTHKRDFATVTLIPGRCFDRGGGGGIGFYNNREEEPNFCIFPESLDQKEAIGVVFRSMDHPQAILEPRRVRVTLIPGSTLYHGAKKVKNDQKLKSRGGGPALNIYSEHKVFLRKGDFPFLSSGKFARCLADLLT